MKFSGVALSLSLALAATTSLLASAQLRCVVKDGHFDETGDRIVAEHPPMTFFRMHLKRISDSAWPRNGAGAPR